jgi:menaquinone C8-methyltransferase
LLSERILTAALKYLVQQKFEFTAAQQQCLPAPRAGHVYMLYAHIPFCEVLCPFCSFNRYIYNEAAARSYFAHLRKEMELVARLGYRFESMYIGGGTPTIMIDELCQTIDLAHTLFDLKEISCETNPNHLNEEVVEKLRGRVQRLSVGVQSFDDGLLAQMKRLQKFGSGQQILERIQSFAMEFQTFNVDMIFNFPSQTMDILKRDIAKVIESQAKQICFYPLMTAPSVSDSITNTIGVVNYQREVDYYRQICEDMGSNFETTSAWTFSRKHGGMIDEYIIDYEEYVGIGSGAFSYLDGGLYVNTFSPYDYQKKIDSGALTVSTIRQFDKQQQMRYRFMMDLFGLRLDKQRFKHDFGVSVDLGLLPEMTFMQVNGAFSVNDEKIILLTPKGRYLLVVMMREFFSQIDCLREQGRRSLTSEERLLFLGMNDALSTF